ncbi:MAG: hypothetical protein ACOC0F_03265 [archaeon]
MNCPGFGWFERVRVPSSRRSPSAKTAGKTPHRTRMAVEYMGEPLTDYLKDESTKVVEF